MKDLATLTVLIDSFAKLPGVGVKTAERMAYAVLEMDEEDAADYMLTGSVKLMVQNNGKKQERTYIVNIELTDLKTHRTVAMFEPSEATKDYLKKTASIKSK